MDTYGIKDSSASLIQMYLVRISTRMYHLTAMKSTSLSSWLSPPPVALSVSKDLVARRVRSFADAQDDKTMQNDIGGRFVSPLLMSRSRNELRSKGLAASGSDTMLFDEGYYLWRVIPCMSNVNSRK